MRELRDRDGARRLQALSALAGGAAERQLLWRYFHRLLDRRNQQWRSAAVSSSCALFKQFARWNNHRHLAARFAAWRLKAAAAAAARAPVAAPAAPQAAGAEAPAPAPAAGQAARADGPTATAVGAALLTPGGEAAAAAPPPPPPPAPQEPQEQQQQQQEQQPQYATLSPPSALPPAAPAGGELPGAGPPPSRFSLRLACDLFGCKHNIRISFGSVPRVSDLINIAESMFDARARATRPREFPDVPYHVQTFQIFDQVLQRWVDLYSSDQLQDNCQLFSFPPENAWHSDAQGVIPEASDALVWCTAPGSVLRFRQPCDFGMAPLASEKAHSVFNDLDRERLGRVRAEDLHECLSRCGIEFLTGSGNTGFVDLLFAETGAGSAGVDFARWAEFGRSRPEVVDALYFRLRDIYQSGALGSPPPELAGRRTTPRDLHQQHQHRLELDYEAARRAAESARREQRVAAIREADMRTALAYPLLPSTPLPPPAPPL
eukprot:TRINITY_DN13578_c0_g1_i1.p1 TRINITY_DN13578_c0_g1~~TRINITY_DN13578_c0_g1_i1.p1  ORF type:complete len:515 (+),score=134.82 TRINITY_DN13578_c0_g1_i1:76-1545(+)